MSELGFEDLWKSELGFEDLSVAKLGVEDISQAELGAEDISEAIETEFLERRRVGVGGTENSTNLPELFF